MAENAKSNNPLSSYFRQPKLFITLPSGGKYYDEGALDRSANDEYAVYSMTAKDELIFKTPDALLNGQATVELIKSCVPAIKNPWGMPSLDLDACLIAIRVATYGDTMDFNSTCPSCNAENTFELNLVGYLDKTRTFNYQDTISVEPLIIKIRPYNYREITQASLKAMETQKIFQVINDENMSEEEKIDRFGQSFMKLTELTVDVIADCISAVVTPDGEVTDRAQIKEFIDNAPKDVFNAVNDHITSLKETIEMKVQDVACTECGTEYQISLTIDQSNFFAVGS